MISKVTSITFEVHKYTSHNQKQRTAHEPPSSILKACPLVPTSASAYGNGKGDSIQDGDMDVDTASTHPPSHVLTLARIVAIKVKCLDSGPHY